MVKKEMALVKKALLRRIRRLALACGSDRPEIVRLLAQIDLATWSGDYEQLFIEVDELCKSLLNDQLENEK